MITNFVCLVHAKLNVTVFDVLISQHHVQVAPTFVVVLVPDEAVQLFLGDGLVVGCSHLVSLDC